MYIHGHLFCSVVVRTCTRFRQDCLNYYVGGSTTTHAATYWPWFILAERPIDRTYTFATRQTMLHTLRPGGSQLSGGIKRHFLACEDVAGGSQLSGEETFFSRNKDALPCVRRYSWWVATCTLRWYFPEEERMMQYSRDKYFPQLRTKVINPVGESHKTSLTAHTHTKANTCTQRK